MNITEERKQYCKWELIDERGSNEKDYYAHHGTVLEPMHLPYKKYIGVDYIYCPKCGKKIKRIKRFDRTEILWTRM